MVGLGNKELRVGQYELDVDPTYHRSYFHLLIFSGYPLGYPWAQSHTHALPTYFAGMDTHYPWVQNLAKSCPCPLFLGRVPTDTHTHGRNCHPYLYTW